MKLVLLLGLFTHSRFSSSLRFLEKGIREKKGRMMKTLPSTRPKGGGRIRHQVGFKYLEALQSKVLREALLEDQANEELGMGALVHLSVEDKMKNMSVLGMSGLDTSKGKGLDLLVLGVCEGENMVERGDVDFVLCRFRQEGPDEGMEVEILEVCLLSQFFTFSNLSFLLPSHSYSTPKDKRLIQTQYDTIQTPPLSLSLLANLQGQTHTSQPLILPQLDQQIGHKFSTAIHLFSQKHHRPLDTLDLISSGGLLLSLSSYPPSNICLGEGSVIAAKTGVTTVSDFRTTEQAVGRRGTGMFSFLIGLLLHDEKKLQICVSIQGGTSVYFIPPECKGGVEGIYNWDVGPGSHLLSCVSSLLNPMGTFNPSHTQGEICHEVIEELLEHDIYLHTRPPKTISPKEQYGTDFAMRIITMCQFRGCDAQAILATTTRFISASIAQQLLLFGPGRQAINNSDIILDFQAPSSEFALHPPYMYDERVEGPDQYSQILTDLALEFPSAQYHSFTSRTGIPSGNGKERVGFAMLAVEALLGRAVVCCLSSLLEIRHKSLSC